MFVCFYRTWTHFPWFYNLIKIKNPNPNLNLKIRPKFNNTAHGSWSFRCSPLAKGGPGVVSGRNDGASLETIDILHSVLDTRRSLPLSVWSPFPEAHPGVAAKRYLLSPLPRASPSTTLAHSLVSNLYSPLWCTDDYIGVTNLGVNKGEGRAGGVAEGGRDWAGAGAGGGVNWWLRLSGYIYKFYRHVHSLSHT